MQKPPKYKVGTKIYDKINNKWGAIEEVWLSDYGDSRFFSWAYYVRHSGYVWSLFEKYLTTTRPKVK